MRLSRASLCRGCPARSPLATWHWLLALGLLVLNDHVLKGSHLVPSWLSGKLSDFAGLYLAPVLLSVLLRGVLRAWDLSEGHVLRWLLPLSAAITGIGFMALQLSVTVEHVVEVASALLGVPWAVTRDASDLLALPMVLLSVRCFSPWFRPRTTCRRAGGSCECPAVRAGVAGLGWERAAGGPISRRIAAHERGRSRDRRAGLTTERVLASLGLVACIATSPDENWGANSRIPRAPVIVNTSLEASVELRVQWLAEDVMLDCQQISVAPGERLPRAAFSARQRLVLEPGRSLFLEDMTGLRPCHAVIVQLEGQAPQVLFWSQPQLRLGPVPVIWETEPENGDGLLLVRFDGQRSSRLDDGGAGLIHRFGAADARHCPARDAALDTWWLEATTSGRFGVLSRRDTADGCVALELAMRADLRQQAPQQEPLMTAADAVSTAFGSSVAEDGGAPVAEDGGAPVAEDGGAPVAEDGGAPGSDGADVTADAGTGGRALMPQVNEAGAGVEPAVGEPAVAGTSSALLLCVPPEHVPMEVGGEFFAERDEDGTLLRLTAVDASWRLHAFQRATRRLSLAPFELEPVADDACEFVAVDEPLSTLRSAGLSVDGPWARATLSVGETAMLDAERGSYVVGLLAATQNLVSNSRGSVPLGMSYSGFILEENE